jgi:hypothetical protein
MLNIEKVDTDNKRQVKRFVELPHRIYANCPQWVPPLNIDAYNQLNRKKHPFHEHSDVEFFLAVRDGRDVGRIAVIENKPFNKYHNTKKADFYLFECENDMEAATALFNTGFDWAMARGLNMIVGPKGMGPLDGYGILVFGHEHRQTMTMLNYNHAYYQQKRRDLKRKWILSPAICPLINSKFPSAWKRSPSASCSAVIWK